MTDNSTFILVFDADNTLWDTDAIFHAAQTSMLTPFEKLGCFRSASDKISSLRILDQILMDELKIHEYDFTLLSKCLLFYFLHKLDYKTAVQKSLDTQTEILDLESQKIVEDSARSHSLSLAQIPALLPGVEKVLNHLKEFKGLYHNVVSILFSEGSLSRLERIIDHYKFKDKHFFNRILIAPKAKESFERAKRIGRRHFNSNNTVTSIMVGDSLKRDIAPANEAGFVTVYIPGKFKGEEVPENEIEKPSYQIRDISELPEVLNNIGLLRSIVPTL